MFIAGISRICDTVGILLLAGLGWRMFFDFDSSLQTPAFIVGVVGVAACWTNRTAAKNMPLPILAYVGVAVVGTAVHQWVAVSSAAEPEWLSLFAPAVHLLVMATFIYGAAHLVRTPTRISWFVLALVASTGVIAAQIAFDRAASNFVYERGGPSLASVPHWSGIHGTSLLLSLAFPIVIAPMLIARSAGRLFAGGILAGGLLMVAYLNGSRGGLATMIVVASLMAVFAFIARARITVRPMTTGVLILAIAGGLLAAVWFLRGFVEHGANFSGRTLIWQATAKLTLDHPWIGVGLGNYSSAMVVSGHAEEFIRRYGGLHNAHNLLLHTAAETGLVGALCLAVLFAWALRACWRLWAHGLLPSVSLGLFFACTSFLLHSLSENFLDSRAQVERTRLVVWMLLSAALVLERLPRRAVVATA